MQGDTWHLAAELHKLELILNALTFGYSVLYVEPTTAVFRNPMPHLLSLTVGHSPALLMNYSLLSASQAAAGHACRTYRMLGISGTHAEGLHFCNDVRAQTSALLA